MKSGPVEELGVEGGELLEDVVLAVQEGELEGGGQPRAGQEAPLQRLLPEVEATRGGGLHPRSRQQARVVCKE